MSVQKPATAEEVRHAIDAGRPFAGTKINAHHIAVLTGALRKHSEPLTGELAAEVLRTMTDYSEQYLTGGGRERAPWHVVYYVTVRDPENPRARLVLGYLTAANDVRMVPLTRTLGISPALRDAVASLSRARTRRMGITIATERGVYPVQPEGHRDGEGVTFTLWSRDTRADVRETRARAHYTDRSEAYAAKIAAEAEGEPYVSPSGYRGTRSHAWITRGATPIGSTWTEHLAMGGQR